MVVDETEARMADLLPRDIHDVLAERGKRYGEFRRHAAIAQELKRVMSGAGIGHPRMLADDQQEALGMIMHKVARILNGDPDYADSWRDIAGYATLVADRLERREVAE